MCERGWRRDVGGFGGGRREGRGGGGGGGASFFDLGDDVVEVALAVDDKVEFAAGWEREVEVLGLFGRQVGEG